jgi:hypothetical protein
VKETSPVWKAGPVFLVAPAKQLFGNLAELGLLTPTAVRLDESRVRVFAAARSRDGRARIVWFDLNACDLSVAGVSGHPVLDVGHPGSFDQDGVILGDVLRDPDTGGYILCYVGFQRVPTVKFRALSGLASAATLDGPFVRSGMPVVRPAESERTRYVEALHQLQYNNDSVVAHFAIGTSWEVLDGVRFPVYAPYRASGPDVLSLTLDAKPTATLPATEDVYRLGRPREISVFGKAILVATGMTRAGVYSPYLFEKDSNDSWQWNRSLDIGVRPGRHDLAIMQACYPTTVSLGAEEELVLFNGDAMGGAGILGCRLRRVA